MIVGNCDILYVDKDSQHSVECQVSLVWAVQVLFEVLFQQGEFRIEEEHITNETDVKIIWVYRCEVSIVEVGHTFIIELNVAIESCFKCGFLNFILVQFTNLQLAVRNYEVLHDFGDIKLDSQLLEIGQVLDEYNRVASSEFNLINSAHELSPSKDYIEIELGLWYTMIQKESFK